MNYPLISEYIEAIRSAEDNFDKLSNLRPVLDNNGNPIMSSGNFAVVFKMQDIDTGRFFAVKCFTREQDEREERYKEIIKELENNTIPYFVNIQYMENELYVDTQQSDMHDYPILLMDWVEGVTLDLYMKTIAHNPYKRELLAIKFQHLVCWLLPKHFAHGDLKPENIIVNENGNIVLVDYDGMFVPSLNGKTAIEMGTPMFIHHGRTVSFFNEYIDDYAAVLILVLLKVNAISPINFDKCLKNNTVDYLKQFENYLNNPSVAPILAAFIMVSTFGRIDRTQIFSMLADNTNYDFNKEQDLLYSAQKGDVSSMISLGNIYDEGIYAPKNTSKAIQWYYLAKLMGDKNAVCHLCNCISLSDDLNITNESVIKCLGEGKVNFAYCRNGHDLYNKDNFKSALYWFNKASELGVIRAKTYIALCYMEGQGVVINQKKAAYLFENAAKEGDMSAQRIIGDYYTKGVYYEKDPEKAFEWYSKAAESGDSHAQNSLGICFQHGIGITKHPIKAIYWYKRASESGNSAAKFNLGYCYFNGIGLGKDMAKGFYWFFQAAKSGNKDAFRNLGVCYEMGYGIEKNFEMAVYWYIKAAEAGNCLAQCNLALCYEQGNGVEKDLQKALYWYQKAADGGDSFVVDYLEHFCKKNKLNDEVNVTKEEINVCNTKKVLYSQDKRRLLLYTGYPSVEYIINEGTEFICDESFNDLYSEIEGYSISKIILPSTLKRIGNNVFCSSISSFITKSPNFIVDDCFLLSQDKKTLYRYFGKDKIVTIPEGINYIKGGAFSDLFLKKVIIPSSVVHIGDNPFAGCNAGIEIISYSTRFIVDNFILYDDYENRLIGCTNGSNGYLMIRNRTKLIGKNAFLGLVFSDLFLPDTIQHIEETAFWGCSNLRNIYVPSRQFDRIHNLIPLYIRNKVSKDNLPF